jgi:signal transduction histidine kinase
VLVLGASAVALGLARFERRPDDATLAAVGATRALRALARSALAVDGTTRPVLADPGPGAPAEVRVLHEALDTMLDRQEEARRALAEREVLASHGTMAAGIAHEIRTPLAVLHGSAEMLARDPADAGRRRELTDLITKESDRLERLVATLLTFARPRPPLRQREDLADVCRRALPTLRALAEQHGVELEAELQPAVASLDPEQLQQVVLNLAANAIHASPRSAMVRLSTGREDGKAVLEVADRGAGIPSADLPRIWAPFFTTRASGTGLGLAIVRRIVDAHDGGIDVTTAPGAGTTMRVTLDASDA